MTKHLTHRTEARADAEVKMGELLLETERAKGTLKRGPVVTTSDHGKEPTLAALGLTKNESAQASTLAGWDALDQEARDAWHARADAARKALGLYFQPGVLGMAYAGSHAARLSLWCEGVVRDVGLVTLPDLEPRG